MDLPVDARAPCSPVSDAMGSASSLPVVTFGSGAGEPRGTASWFEEPAGRTLSRPLLAPRSGPIQVLELTRQPSRAVPPARARRRRFRVWMLLMLAGSLLALVAGVLLHDG